MEKINIWIDCDPGIDDAVALAMAAASRDRLHILGISTVAGNQTSDRVTGNALKLASFLGMDDVPVVRGARGPLVREVEPAGDIHGATGLGNCELPATTKQTASESGIFYMYSRIMELPEEEKVTLVPTGPLTNIALLLRTFPQVQARIEKIVLMGGSSSGGNVTPAAEFNIWADPEAAQMVFAAGLPTVMVPIVWFLELFSTVLRVLTLAVRLYGNMFAGHMVLGIFALLTSLFIGSAIDGAGFVSALPSVGWILFLLVMYALEVLVAFLQAYVFTILTAVYVSLATSSH